MVLKCTAAARPLKYCSNCCAACKIRNKCAEQGASAGRKIIPCELGVHVDMPAECEYCGVDANG